MKSFPGLLLHATVLAACCAGQSPDNTHLPASGLAGYWRFDQDTVCDQSPNRQLGDYETMSGVYYLVFGQHDSVTGGGDSAQHVADGSEIISRHHKTGRRTSFIVGSVRYPCILA